MALTDAKIRAAKPTDKAYKLTDGAGMLMLVHPNSSRYWRLRYRILGKEKTLALGVYPEVSLSEARAKRDEARKLISAGIDPCEQKRAKKVAPGLQLSFEHIARRWHASNKQWTQSHSDKVLKSLETHVFPFIGNRDITKLNTPDLLIPVRAAKAKQIYEIASRLQQRISAVMRYAVQSGIIRYNPALDMAGALTTVKRQHRPALDLSRLPELLSRIGSYKDQPVTRLAVMLNLLVFIRSSELRYARWSEIDIENAMWTIPAKREPLPGVNFSHRGSKMRTPHLVPLSKQAVAILTELQTWAGENGLVFTGAHDPHKPISENTVNKALRVMCHERCN
ncbi:integrase arm-type DNA-binding domain-containing protein, partial [Escherichia coli]